MSAAVGSLVRTPRKRLVKMEARSIAIAAAAIAIGGAFVAFFVFLLFVLPKP